MSDTQLEMDQIRRRLNDERASIQKTTRLTRKVGLIGLLVVALYLLFLYSQYNDVMTPEFAVDYGVSLLEGHLTDARAQLVGMIRGRLPHLLDNLEKTLQDSIPLLRTKLVDEASTRLDARLLDITSEMEIRLSKMWKQKEKTKDSVLAQFQDQVATDHLARQIVEESFKAADLHLVAASGKNIDQHLEQIVAGPSTVFNYLRQVRTSQNPSEQEKAQRELLSMIAGSFGSSKAAADSSKVTVERKPRAMPVKKNIPSKKK